MSTTLSLSSSSLCFARPSATPLCSLSSTAAEMAKVKTNALEHAKKVAKGKKRSSSRPALLPGWTQGDWIPSVVKEEDLEGLVTDGLLAPGS